MKLILTTAALAVAIVLPSAALAAPVGSGPTATVNGTATAEIVAPLQIGCRPMHWGQLAPLHTGTYVVMNAQGNPPDDPSDTLVVPGTVTSAQPGHCDVTGESLA